MAHWKYDFDCRKCERLQYVKDDIRDGLYCIPTMNHHDPLHADDDRVVRCDDFRPRSDQMSLFEGR